MTTTAPVPYRLERDRTALLVVDMQNDFVREGGALELPDARARIDQVIALVNRTRAWRMPVIFTKFIAGPAPTLIWHWSPSIAPSICCCRRNFKRYYPEAGQELETTEIISEIPVLPEDTVVEKYAYDAFYNSNLEDVLRALNRRQVIICGATMPICINETVAGAFERQFEVVVAHEACSSVNEEYRVFSLKLFAFKFGRVLSHREIFAELDLSQGIESDTPR